MASAKEEAFMSYGRYVAILLRTQRGAFGCAGFALVAYGQADVRDVKFRTLDTEYEFLDWTRGCFPALYQDVKHAGHLRHVLSQHIIWKRQDKHNPRMPKTIQRRDTTGQWFIASKAAVPSSYEGLHEGDACAVLVTNPLDVVLGELVSRAVDAYVPLIVVREIRNDRLHVDPSNFGVYVDVYRLWAHCILTVQNGGYGDGI